MRVPYHFIAMALAAVCITPSLSSPFLPGLPRQASDHGLDHGSNHRVNRGVNRGVDHGVDGGFDHAVTTQKVVALTFDADMTLKMRDELKSGKVASWYNANVIAVLQRENIPATLFLTGLWIEAYPEITKQLSQNPLFELGVESFDQLLVFHPVADVANVTLNAFVGMAVAPGIELPGADSTVIPAIATEPFFSGELIISILASGESLGAITAT